MNQRPVVAYSSQLGMLLGFLGVSLIVSGLLLSWLSSMMLNVPLMQAGDALLKPENVQFSRFANAVATFLAFFIPSWAVAKIASKNPMQELGFNSHITIRQVAAVGAIGFGALFISGSLAEINEMIPMPASFLAKAKQMEDDYIKTMLSLANMKDIWDLLLGLLVIAVAPAIFEEVLFRSGLQRILVGLTKNAFLGILIASILFSAIHGSYFGFLPRVALGVILGLIYHYGNNIWLAILMHFLNNAVVVIQIFMYTQAGKPIKEAIEESMPIWYGLIGLVVVVPAILFLKKEANTFFPKASQTVANESVD